MENLTWVVMVIGASVGGLTMMLGFRKPDQKPAPFGQIAGALKQDWTRTGNIDFHASALESSSPQPLTLRVEEKRIKESAVGQDVIELRWRLATLEEGKELVICWNTKQNDRIYSDSTSALLGAGEWQRGAASSQELLRS